MSKRIRIGLQVLAYPLPFVIISPVVAQTVAPTQIDVDTNGVDLREQNFIFSNTEISIGGEGNGLALIRTWNGGGWRDNFSSILYNAYPTVFVDTGATADSFTFSGGSFVNDKGNGATYAYPLGGVPQFVSRRGVKITFRVVTEEDVSSSPSTFGRSEQFEYPNGLIVKVHYKTVNYSGTIQANRIQSVTNNAGYQLKFEYGRNDTNNLDVEANRRDWLNVTKVTAINNTIDYCDPDADACTGLTQSWPSTTYTRSTSGTNQLLTVTDAAGRATRYTTNASGRMIGIKHPTSTSDDVTITDNYGYVQSITRGGLTWTYNYVPAPAPYYYPTIVVSDPNGHQRVTGFNNSANSLLPTWVRDEIGRTTYYDYDSSSRLSTITDPEGGKVVYQYDPRGNVGSITHKSKTPGTPPDIVTSATFDVTCTNLATCNEPNTTTDALNHTTNYSYTSFGSLQVATLPAPTTGAVRPEVRYTYSGLQAYFKNSSGSVVASGQPIYLQTGTSVCQTGSSCSGTADEIATSISYGPTGVANNLLPTSVSKGAGNGTLTAATGYTYDVIGNRLTVDGPLPGAGDTTRIRYDSVRQVVGVVGPDPDGAGPRKPLATRYSYSPEGEVSSTELGTVDSQSDADWAAMSVQQQAAVIFDGAGRKIETMMIAGGATQSLTQYSYDNEGRRECIARRMNPVTYGSLPASACTLGTAGSFGPDRIVKITYDAANQSKVIQTAYGTSEQADEQTIGYNDNGTIATVSDAQGNKTSYLYDGFDRLSQITYPSLAVGSGTSSGTDYEQLIYDANSNIASWRLRGYASDSGSHIDYTYDALDRPTFKNLPGSEADVTYAYDNIGRLTSATDSTGNYVNLAYDALGRLVSQTAPLGTIQTGYDLANRRVLSVWPDASYVNYDRRVTGAVTTIRENGATSGIGVLATYTYDDLGRRTSLTLGNGVSTSYGYDAASELSTMSWDLPGTAYDQALTFTHNPAGQVTSTTRSNDIYAYTGNANANTVTTVNGLNQATAVGAGTITYDARGNLASTGSNNYTYSAENHLLTGPVATFTYDPLGRLYRVSSVTGGDSYFMYDREKNAAWFNSTGSLVTRNVFGPGADEPLVQYAIGTGTHTWQTADERGTIIAGTNDSGGVNYVSRYDEYGVPVVNYANRFQYTGQAWIREVGIYYYRNRFYSPRLGRFMQPDPIRYGDGMNIYNYVGGDPINRIDPTGLDEVTVYGQRDFPSLDNSWSSPGGTGFAYVNQEGAVPPVTINTNSDVVVTGQRLKGPIYPMSGSGPSPLLPPADPGDVTVTARRMGHGGGKPRPTAPRKSAPPVAFPTQWADESWGQVFCRAMISGGPVTKDMACHTDVSGWNPDDPKNRSPERQREALERLDGEREAYDAGAEEERKLREVQERAGRDEHE